MADNKILQRILNLLERNEKNGATKHEAEVALKIANKLMAEYNITEFDLKKVDRSSFVDKPFDMFRLDIVSVLQDLAETFDCESYYYKRKKEFHFFGFEIDVKLCLHFAQMISQVLSLEIKQYKNSIYYAKLCEIYQPQLLIRNFVAGFSNELSEKLEQLRREKEEIVLSNGTSLMVIKKQQVNDEFNRLNPNIKISKNSFHFIREAMLSGAERAENISFNKPIETDIEQNLLQIENRKVS